MKALLSVIFLVLAAALPVTALAQSEAAAPAATPDAVARAAARKIVASDPTGISSIQPPEPQVILEASEAGGKAKAVVGFEFDRAKLKLELLAPFQDGSNETDLLTLDRVPGDAVATLAYAYELNDAKPPNLKDACTLANSQVIGSYREVREKLTPILRSPPVDLEKGPLGEMVGYAAEVGDRLAQTTGFSAAALSARIAARNAVCAAASTSMADRLVADLYGLSEADLEQALPGRQYVACSLAAASLPARVDAVAAAAAAEITRLYETKAFQTDVDKAVAKALAALPIDADQPTKDETASTTRKAALTEARTQRAANIQQAITPAVASALTDADKALFKELDLAELINSYHGGDEPEKRAENTQRVYRSTDNVGNRLDVLVRSLEANWKSEAKRESAGHPAPAPAGGGPPASILPEPARKELERRLVLAEAKWLATFESKMASTVVALAEPPSYWTDYYRKGVIDAAAAQAGAGPVMAKVARTYLAKLIPAYATLVTSFNELPFDNLIEAGEGLCSVTQLEARIAALPRGRARNSLFKAYVSGLPTLVNATAEIQGGSADFKWLATFPPTIEQNKIQTKQATRYNTSIGGGVTLLHQGWYYAASYSQQRKYTALPAANVCLPLTGGTSGSQLCTNSSPGPPGQSSPEVASIGAKHFWTPDLAVNLVAYYDFDIDSFNPHVFFYFLPQKGSGLRGGLDLGYVSHHPERGDRFEARIFIGAPVKLWD
ncbi:MAG TPA: hypothetical protein VGS57_09300 [Thermoanaerobaculia bacterium]|jgi:hypothetical protein|nr:hypothetical protein [Thermoanaerobaculia bacterium]